MHWCLDRRPDVLPLAVLVDLVGMAASREWAAALADKVYHGCAPKLPVEPLSRSSSRRSCCSSSLSRTTKYDMGSSTTSISSTASSRSTTPRVDVKIGGARDPSAACAPSGSATPRGESTPAANRPPPPPPLPAPTNTAPPAATAARRAKSAAPAASRPTNAGGRYSVDDLTAIKIDAEVDFLLELKSRLLGQKGKEDVEAASTRAAARIVVAAAQRGR